MLYSCLSLVTLTKIETKSRKREKKNIYKKYEIIKNKKKKKMIVYLT